MSEHPGTIAITGASGFIGTAMVRAFLQAGWEVRAAVRRPDALQVRSGRVHSVHVDLPKQLPAEFIAGADLCLHAAWTTVYRNRREALAVNVDGSRALVTACRSNRVPMIFLSSFSAHPGAKSLYGRTKLEVEGMLDPRTDLIVQPGFVLGSGGLCQRMMQSIRRSKFIPLIDGGRQPVQTVDVLDLARCTLALALREHTGYVPLAHPQVIEFRRLLEELADAVNRRPCFLPIRSELLMPLLRSAEALGLGLPVSSENLLGLQAMRTIETGPLLENLGLPLRPMADSLRTLAAT